MKISTLLLRHRNLWLRCLVLSSSSLLVACPSKSDKPATEGIASYEVAGDISKKAEQVHAIFDDETELSFAKLSPEGKLKPGQRVSLSLYWKAPPKISEGDYRLFTHIIDKNGKRILNIDSAGPLRQIEAEQALLGPSHWAPNKQYIDKLEFDLPENIHAGDYQIIAGIYRGDKRRAIKMGPATKDSAVIAASFSIDQGKAIVLNRQIPTLRSNRLPKGSTIKIDGKLTESEWASAADTGPFVNVATGGAAPSNSVQGSAKILWDEQYLYVAFDVNDRDVRGGFPKDAIDPHLWTKDTVEIMLDPDGDGDNRHYYEIQINPQNLVFDSHFDRYNLPRGGPDGPFGHQDWSAKLISTVQISGSIDDDSDQDSGYVVEAKIPWKSFERAQNTPPKLGDTWRINFYAMKNNGGVAWSPILGEGNFHKSSRFGRVTFADKDWIDPKTKAESSTDPKETENPKVAPKESDKP